MAKDMEIPLETCAENYLPWARYASDPEILQASPLIGSLMCNPSQRPKVSNFLPFPILGHTHYNNYPTMLLSTKSGTFGLGSHLHPAFFLM